MEGHTHQKSKTTLSSHGDPGSQNEKAEEKLEAPDGKLGLRAEAVKNRNSDMRQTFEKLAELCKEGKDQNDAEVTEMLKGIFMAPEIPFDILCTPFQPLHDLIGNLQKHVDALQYISVSPSDIKTSKDILKTASGGLSLTGVYNTGKTEDMLKERQQLIEAPESFSLCDTQESPIFVQEGFPCEEALTEYENVMKRLGLSSCHSFNASCRFPNDGGTIHPISEQSGMVNIQYNYIKLASGSLQKDELKLSASAIRKLTEIEEILLYGTEDQTTEKVTEFFEHFGSHALVGPLCFGGVFLWRASAEDFGNTDLTEVRNLVSESLAIYTCADFTGSSLVRSDKDNLCKSKLKELLAGKYDDSLLSKVQLSVRNIGGPPESDDYLQWKLDLLRNKGTWSVIDRGTMFVPVWDIISNHEESFKDPSRLLEVMENVYTRNTQTESRKGLRKDEIPRLKEAKGTFLQMLETVGLRDYYPQKMQKGDVFIIDSLQDNEPKREKQTGLHYLHRLMMLDCNARDIATKSSDEFDKAQCTNIQNSYDFFNDDSESTDDGSPPNKHTHPMDIHIAVFLCADDFLRQYICTKLALCQFALPLLVPDPCTGEVEFPLWALRQIKKSWKSFPKSGEEALELDNQLLCSASVPIVSFIRLGSSSHSKSQILNNVISKQKHNVFFHRHCRGSTPNALLMDGVVEVSWYLPGGRKDDIFDRCVAFMNLHGDASKHPKQLKFLKEVSTVIMVLLSENPLDGEAGKVSEALFDSSAPLICLFSGKERIPPGPNKTKVRLAVKNRNESHLSDEITHHINYCVESHKKAMSLEDCLIEAKNQLFKVDEDKRTCKEGQDQAQKILNILMKEEKEKNRRQACFPLQGETWQEWCKLDKKEHRLDSKTGQNLEQEMCDIKAAKKEMRQEQFKLSSPPNDLMGSFIECLDSSIYSEHIKLYMQHWLRIFLDGKNSEYQKQVQEQYHRTWMNKRIFRESKDGEIEQKLQNQLKLLTKHLKENTFEFHDFIREAAQMYEAAQASSVTKKNQLTKMLPSIAAKMLISGCHLELINGETAHVPLVWISSVLDELIAKLGDRKVFVLSVLGLQSSGKSTLLNSMFGLQFAVSAGRCTRGAFMQLLTVGEEMREQLQYDLVLVVDTEGLRSPEVDNNMVRHDNELATFVIGISDMALINIMGECPVEMQDILQICVQAFLRMKQVKITPSLTFVHQNVADVSAGDKNMEAKRCLLRRLDEMAVIAAKEEHVEVNGFNDVIQFDVDTQVFYFKSLLQGDPPMAPPNPSYSQNVQELKTQLLSIVQRKTDHKLSSLNAFKSQVQDLWEALLAENFVFSFTNTLEASVNKALEEQCAKWGWTMRKKALEIQNSLTNQIKNENIHDVKTLRPDQDLDPTYRSITTEMENYFSTEKHADILVQYKQSIVKRFENLKLDIAREIKCNCIDFINLTKSLLELNMKKREYESELLEMSKSLACDLKSKNLTDENVRNEFDSLWQNWMEKIPNISWKNENVMVIVTNSLKENFKHVPKIDARIKRGNKTFKFNNSEHICKGWGQVMSESLMLSSGSPLEETVNALTQNIQDDIQRYIKGKEDKKMDFSVNFIHEILGKIKDHIAEAKKTLPKLTDSYTTDLSISLCKLAAERFQKMHEDFKETNDPVTVLQSQREEYRQLFEKYCQDATSTTFCVEFLCNKLRPAVQQAVFDKTCVQVIDLLKSNCSAFKDTRSNLEKHMMRHLAEKEDFDSFMEYINNPRTFYMKFIEETALEYFTEDDPRDIVLPCLGSLKILIMEKVNTTEMRQSSFSLWLDAFCKDIDADVKLSRQDLQNIEEDNIDDEIFFKKTLSESFEKMFSTIENELAGNQCNISNFRANPVEILVQEFSGCWEQCPFCKAVCSNADPKHEGDHCAQFHRPQALGTWAYSAKNWFERIFKGKEMVCSFRDSVEMKIHKTLEDRFSILTWQLRKHALQIQTELQNQIANDIKETVLKPDLKFKNAKINVTKEIKACIKNEDETYVGKTWQTGFVRRYKMQKKGLRQETKNLCKTQNKNKTCTNLIQEKSQHEAMLFQKMKNTASKVKVREASDEIIVKKFDHLWTEWQTDIFSRETTEEFIDVNTEVNRILQKTFSKDLDISKKLTDENNQFIFSEKYVTMKPYFLLIFRYAFSSIDQDVTRLLENIENTTMKRIEKLEGDFHSRVIRCLLHDVKMKLYEFEHRNKTFSFTEDMITDFSVYLCKQTVPVLHELHQRFRNSKYSASFFERTKADYLQVFKNLCQGAASTVFFADVLCSKLKQAIMKSVYVKASTQIVDEIMTQFEPQTGSMSNMESALLKCFQHPGDHFHAEITEEIIHSSCKQHVKKYDDTNNNLVKILHQILDDIQEEIVTSCEAAIRTVKCKGGNASMYMDELCRNIGSALEFPRYDLKNIENIVDGGVEAVENSVGKALSEMWEDLKREITKPIHTQMVEKRASQILTLHLKERWEQCKLCKNSLFEADSAVGTPLRFSVNFCTTFMSSNATFIPGNGLKGKIAWSEYRKAGVPYANWKITPTLDSTLYWKWFICRFKIELERKYNRKFEGTGSIPKEWTLITKKIALDDLK